MSRYLDIARRAATRKEHHESAKAQTRERSLAFPPRDKPRTPDPQPNEAHEKPIPPMPERDKGGEGDRSSDYQAVLKVLRDPPYWLRDSYLSGYRRGTITLPTLSAAVAAALERSPYEWTERLTPLVEQVLEKEVKR